MENNMNKMYCSIVRYFLDTIVLAELKKGEALSGYDIIGFIHRKFRYLISPGTIYALLYSMERKGLVKGEWTGGKRIYVLSNKGEDTINVVLKSKAEIQRFIQTLF